jgi:hypothetical protein
MRVIITGGTGVIGRRTAEFLIEGGHSVVILTRDPATARRLPDGAQVVGWDARTGEGWYTLIDNQTAILNLAGRNPAHWRWTEAHKQAVLSSRLDAAAAVLDGIRRANVRPLALLQASAVGYYGDHGGAPITESAPSGTGFRADVCVQWEAAAATITALGVRTALLRIGIVMTMAGGALPAFALAARLCGQRMGDGRQYFPWIHIDDCVLAILRLLHDTEADGPFNLAAPPVTNQAFMEALTRVVGTAPLIPIPTWALRLTLGEQAGTILDSQRVMPTRLLERGHTFRFVHPEAALRQVRMRTRLLGVRL